MKMEHKKNKIFETHRWPLNAFHVYPKIQGPHQIKGGWHMHAAEKHTFKVRIDETVKVKVNVDINNNFVQLR